MLGLERPRSVLVLGAMVFLGWAAFAPLRAQGVAKSEDEGTLDVKAQADPIGARKELRAVLLAAGGLRRSEAAIVLTRLGEPRGIAALRSMLEARSVGPRPHEAFRALATQGARAQSAAPALSGWIKDVLSGGWDGSPEQQALLGFGAIALARLERKEDQSTVIEIARVMDAHGLRSPLVAEALGLAGGLGARELLEGPMKPRGVTLNLESDEYRAAWRLALARHGDKRLVEEVRRGVLRALQGDVTARADVLSLFSLLRHRDSAVFGEVVLDVAAAEPETNLTVVAWETLGRMHPEALADRALALALSKRPHWASVSRQLLSDVVMACNPELNETFWRELGVVAVPREARQRAAVQAGVGYQLFSGTLTWTGD